MGDRLRRLHDPCGEPGGGVRHVGEGVTDTPEHARVLLALLLRVPCRLGEPATESRLRGRGVLSVGGGGAGEAAAEPGTWLIGGGRAALVTGTETARHLVTPEAVL